MYMYFKFFDTCTLDGCKNVAKALTYYSDKVLYIQTSSSRKVYLYVIDLIVECTLWKIPMLKKLPVGLIILHV